MKINNAQELEQLCSKLYTEESRLIAAKQALQDGVSLSQERIETVLADLRQKAGIYPVLELLDALGEKKLLQTTYEEGYKNLLGVNLGEPAARLAYCMKDYDKAIPIYLKLIDFELQSRWKSPVIAISYAFNIGDIALAKRIFNDPEYDDPKFGHKMIPGIANGLAFTIARKENRDISYLARYFSYPDYELINDFFAAQELVKEFITYFVKEDCFDAAGELSFALGESEQAKDFLLKALEKNQPSEEKHKYDRSWRRIMTMETGVALGLFPQEQLGSLRKEQLSYLIEIKEWWGVFEEAKKLGLHDLEQEAKEKTLAELEDEPKYPGWRMNAVGYIIKWSCDFDRAIKNAEKSLAHDGRLREAYEKNADIESKEHRWYETLLQYYSNFPGNQIKIKLAENFGDFRVNQFREKYLAELEKYQNYDVAAKITKEIGDQLRTRVYREASRYWYQSF